MVERSSVRFGGTTIPFQVRRSGARTQVSLIVQAGQKDVIVRSPRGTPLERLAAVVRQRGPWVLAKLRQVERADQPAQPKEFVSGESFTYLGRSFRLNVRVASAPRPARLERGWLEVEISRGLKGSGRRRTVRAAVVEWFRGRAMARLPERLERFTSRLDLPAPRLLLRDQAGRWGSCNEKGEVRLNWRIVQAPMVLVDYVAAHEAVHLIHKNHTKAYWAELAKLLPDAEGRRTELARRGAAWVW